MPEKRFLRGVLEDLNDLVADPDRATQELAFLLEESPKDHDAMERYVQLVQAADGRADESLREAHRLLEKAGDRKALHKAYRKLLQATRDPKRALDDYTNLPKGDAPTVLEFARHVTRAGDATPEQVRQSFRKPAPTSTPQQPPHLARAQATLTKLTGSPDAARAEMQWALQATPQALERYVDLVQAADGVELDSLKQIHSALENGPQELRPALKDLLAACRRNAAQALAEYRWLQAQKSDQPERIHAYAGLLRTAGDAKPDMLHQLWTNLNGTASQRDVQEVLKTGALRAPELRDTQRKLAEILGPDHATRELDALLARQPKDGALDRYVQLVKAADGLELDAVRVAFDRLEAQPELRDAFLRHLEACDRNAALALDHLQRLQTDALDALPFHTKATRVTDDFATVEFLRKLPEADTALRRLPELLERGVPPQEAARDLELLHRHDTSDEAFQTLLELREEALPDAHQGVRDAMAFFLKTADEDQRDEQARTFRKLVRVEGDPSEALQDLQWLVAGQTDAGEYLDLIQRTDAAGRPPVRKALQELHATPDRTPAPTFLQRLTGRHVNRDAAFRRLYEMEGGRADQALQDLKVLERMLAPGETLGHALKEMESLFRMPEANRPEAVRDTFAMLRQAPADNRAALKSEIRGWAEILGDLDLGRRAVAAFKRAVDPDDFQKRGEILAKWRDAEGPDTALMLMEAADEVRAPGQPLAELVDQVQTLRETRDARLTSNILKAAARDARRPGAPFRTRQEAVSHFLTLYRTARHDQTLQAAVAFLEAPERTGTYHERTRILSALANGVQDLATGLQEYAELEKAGALDAAAAYGDLMQTLRGVGVRDTRTQARSLMAWAAEHKDKAGTREILEMLSAQFLLGATVEAARTAVLEKFQPAREVAVEEEFVEIGGVRVPRRRGQS